MRKEIAVLGCFRSGTNYSKSLLELNFDCSVRNNLFGWKHGFVPIVSLDSKVTHETLFDGAYFVTKNPYSFLVSLYRYYKEAKLNILAKEGFDDFVKNRIVIFDGGNQKSPQLRFSSPVELWNSMNWNYSSHSSLIHVRYEMLLERPKATTERIAKKIGLEAKSGSFEIPRKRVKRMNDSVDYKDASDMMTGQKFNSKQYTQNEYMDMFSPELIDFVQEQLDDELVEKLGYTEIVRQLTNQT
ncbi:hypothetical protein ACPV5S_19460 [Vibrio astriarenae]